MKETELYKELARQTKKKEKWKESVPYLSSLLSHESLKIRTKALWLLGEIGLAHPASVKDEVSLLASFFDSDRVLLRERAINAFGRIGRGSFPSIEAYWRELFRFAFDEAAGVRLGFIWASENIATDNPDTYREYMPVFEKLLYDEDDRVRMEAPEIFRVLGSSDLDQSSPFIAGLTGKLFADFVYPLIHEGHFKNRLLQKRFEKRKAEDDSYNRAFMRIIRNDDEDMRFLSKKSLYNQFVSDLVTPLDDDIDNGFTRIHIFYALKMGEKYRGRYLKHFRDPIIYEHDLRHEELLAVYPEQWCQLIREVCL